jgi:predicted PurR-regulated permease PerM
VLISQGIAFLQGLPEYLDQMGDAYAAADLPEWLRDGLDHIIASVQENTESIDQGALVAGFIGGAFGFISGLFAWFLLPFFLFYLLKDQPRMAGSFYERVPLPWQGDVSRILTITVGNFAQYFKAELLVGSIMFVIVRWAWCHRLPGDAPLLVTSRSCSEPSPSSWSSSPRSGPSSATSLRSSWPSARAPWRSSW